jgi:hypothetical protein
LNGGGEEEEEEDDNMMFFEKKIDFHQPTLTFLIYFKLALRKDARSNISHQLPTYHS